MLKQEDALLTGLGVAAVVGAIYAVHVPTVAASRASQPGNMHLNSSRISADWIAAGVVVGASLLAKDPTVFVIGGVMVIALSFAHRFANAVEPTSGKVPTPANAAPAAPVTG